jgi:hypothetical protein
MSTQPHRQKPLPHTHREAHSGRHTVTSRATTQILPTTTAGKPTTPRHPHASWRSLILTLASIVTTALFTLPGIAHAESTCLNEAIRTETNSLALPDCRAYEMVSPPYKEGYPMFALGIARDGEQVILYTLGDLAGIPGSGQTSTDSELYLAERSSTGWGISPMNPPVSQFVGQIPLATESTEGETLWKQHTPLQSAQNRGLYTRSAGGGFGFVGPMSLPVIGEEEPSNVLNSLEKRVDRVVAASDEQGHVYGHVVLRAEASQDYWPFDMTQGNGGSLYEYSGVGNSQPILVGVNGTKGSEQLISQCGTLLGGNGNDGNIGSAYNALSADGETIFFTVEPGCGSAFAEVYARKHGSLSSSSPAKTVDVSARQCSDSECMEESGKNFEGASEDGERVFFTSTQKLTSDAVDRTASGNAAEKGCSAKAADGCNLYEYNFAAEEGKRLNLVAGGEVLGVAGIAEDGTRVYFVSSGVIAGVKANEYGDSPQPGGNNFYVYDTQTGSTAFIAALSAAEGGEKIWQKTFQRPVEITGEGGRFLLFASATPGLTGPEDTSTQVQMFEYDAETEELVRVTKGEEGYNENGNGVTQGIELFSIEVKAQQLGHNVDLKSMSNQLNIAENGRTVLFETAGQLSARAVSAEVGCKSVYEFRTGGALSEGSVHLISDGRDIQPNKGSTCGAEFLAMDDEGANVLFTTADPLVSSDTDGYQRDVYDAREGGGFSAVPGGEVGSCGAGSCEGAVSTPPLFSAPSSATVTGSGNLAPPAVGTGMAIAPKKTTKMVKCAKGVRHEKQCKKKAQTKRGSARKKSAHRKGSGRS